MIHLRNEYYSFLEIILLHNLRIWTIFVSTNPPIILGEGLKGGNILAFIDVLF